MYLEVSKLLPEHIRNKVTITHRISDRPHYFKDPTKEVILSHNSPQHPMSAVLSGISHAVLDKKKFKENKDFLEQLNKERNKNHDSLKDWSKYHLNVIYRRNLDNGHIKDERQRMLKSITEHLKQSKGEFTRRALKNLIKQGGHDLFGIEKIGFRK
jgi:hypothetical protein